MVGSTPSLAMPSASLLELLVSRLKRGAHDAGRLRVLRELVGVVDVGGGLFKPDSIAIYLINVKAQDPLVLVGLAFHPGLVDDAATLNRSLRLRESST